MNILDALTLIVLLAVFLYYCHRKKKLFFRKKGDVDSNNGISGDRDSRKADSASTAPPVSPAAPFPPYMYPYGYMYGAQATAPTGQDFQGGIQNSRASITLFRLIPWTFRFDPLPFTDTGEKAAAADDVVNADIIPLGATLDGEIRTLNAEGYTVSGISAVSLPLGDGAVRVLFCITCTGGGRR